MFHIQYIKLTNSAIRVKGRVTRFTCGNILYDKGHCVISETLLHRHHIQGTMHCSVKYEDKVSTHV